MEEVTVKLLNEEGVEQLVRTLGHSRICLMILTVMTALLLIKLGSILAALWFDSRYPELSDTMLRNYRNDGMKCFLVGLVNVLFGVILALILLNTKILALFGLALLLAIYVIGFTGYVVGYRSAGTTLPLPETWETRAGALIAGGVVAEGSFLIPVLGQLLSLATLLRGFGAVTLSLIAKETPSASSSSEPSSSD